MFGISVTTLPRSVTCGFVSETVIVKNLVATAEQTTADIDTVPVHTSNSDGDQEGLCEQDFIEGFRVFGVVEKCTHVPMEPLS